MTNLIFFSPVQCAHSFLEGGTASKNVFLTSYVLSSHPLPLPLCFSRYYQVERKAKAVTEGEERSCFCDFFEEPGVRSGAQVQRSCNDLHVRSWE